VKQWKNNGGELKVERPEAERLCEGDTDSRLHVDRRAKPDSFFSFSPLPKTAAAFKRVFCYKWLLLLFANELARRSARWLPEMKVMNLRESLSR